MQGGFGLIFVRERITALSYSISPIYLSHIHVITATPPSSSVLGTPHHPNLENVFQLQEEEVNQGHFFYHRIKCVQFVTTRCVGAPLNSISHRPRPKYLKTKYSRTKRSNSYNIKFYTSRTRSKIPRPHSKYRITGQG